MPRIVHGALSSTLLKTSLFDMGAQWMIASPLRSLQRRLRAIARRLGKAELPNLVEETRNHACRKASLNPLPAIVQQMMLHPVLF
jgi:hypothetical protein